MNSAEKLKRIITVIWVVQIIISIIIAIAGLVSVFVFATPFGVIGAVVSTLIGILLTYVYITLLEVFVDIVENTSNSVEREESIYKILRAIYNKMENTQNPLSVLPTNTLDTDKRIEKLKKEMSDFMKLYKSGNASEEEKEMIRQYIIQIDNELKSLGYIGFK